MPTPPAPLEEPLAEGLQLVRYSPAERDAFLAFRRHHYGATSVLADPAYVDWLFGEGAPGSREAGAPVWLCRDAEKVVGAQGFIRVLLQVGKAAVPAAWILDFAVREEVRKHGVGSALAARSRPEIGIRMVLEGTPAAVRIAQRVGSKFLGEVPLWVKPLRVDSYDGKRDAGLKRLGRSLALRLASPALRALEWRALRSAAGAGVELQPTAAFDERADQIWEACAPELSVAGRRDLAFLAWRFGGYPDKSRYRLHWLLRGGATVGYAVLRVGEHHGAPAGHLVDFLCPRALLPALLARTVEIFRREQLAVVCCLHQGPHSARAFWALGFVRRSSGWPFMVRALTATPEVAALMNDPGQWFLTAADSNVDRPRDAG